MFRRREPKNLLEMIPVLKPGISLAPVSGEDGIVDVVIPRTSFLERLSVRFLGQPDRIRVRLDRLGSFVIIRCDGNHRVANIEQMIAERFGEEAEPSLPRLVRFLEILEVNGWIDWKEERG
jgi:hypothetical protein